MYVCVRVYIWGLLYFGQHCNVTPVYLNRYARWAEGGASRRVDWHHPACAAEKPSAALLPRLPWHRCHLLVGPGRTAGHCPGGETLHTPSQVELQASMKIRCQGSLIWGLESGGKMLFLPARGQMNRVHHFCVVPNSSLSSLSCIF